MSKDDILKGSWSCDVADDGKATISRNTVILGPGSDGDARGRRLALEVADDGRRSWR